MKVGGRGIAQANARRQCYVFIQDRATSLLKQEHNYILSPLNHECKRSFSFLCLV